MFETEGPIIVFALLIGVSFIASVLFFIADVLSDWKRQKNSYKDLHFKSEPVYAFKPLDPE